MVKFNPLIEKKLEDLDAPDEIKKFLNIVFQWELQSSSEGVKYSFGKELDSEIAKSSKKMKVGSNED